DRVMTHRGVIRGQVRGIGGNGDRRGKVDLLPAGGRFAAEGGRREKRAGVRPEASGVCPGICRELVKTNATDVACDSGAEPRADFHVAAVGVGSGRNGARGPDAARACAGWHVDGRARCWRLEITAVIGGATLERDGTTAARRPGVAPGLPSCRRV